ncbi:NAD(P)/FAD-dependent oxidoreductase [Lichenicoccus sp.]|uniref:NAD(P)/FAD-dependent oxidoreductase n=1 Tax=Lichenicoccus sp. TaxID=2781899 RepID=UPI003D0D0F71
MDTQPSRAPAPVIVVGGGIIGRVSALRLREAGLDVVLLDPDVASCPVPASTGLGSADPGLATSGPASFGNAGHIAVEQVRPLTNPAFLLTLPRRLFLAGGALDFGWRRPAAWLPWAGRAAAACFRAKSGQRALTSLLADAMPAWQRLAADLGAPALVSNAGHLMLWHKARPGAAAAAGWQRADTGTALAVSMRAPELDRVASHLSVRPPIGLRFEHTGQVRDVAETMRRLGAALCCAGVRRMRVRVRRVVMRDGRLGVELSGPAAGEILWADKILIAAGVESNRLLRGIGIRMPVVAERGYHVEWSHGSDYELPPLVFEERSLIVTRFGARLRASSFVEFDAEDAPPDRRKWARLEAHVRALGLPVASPFSRWVGARPTLPDYLPALGHLPGLGRCPSAAGLFVACGHQHLGLTLAPRTAEIIAALMTGQHSPVALTPFRPDRFGRSRLPGRAVGLPYSGRPPRNSSRC